MAGEIPRLSATSLSAYWTTFALLSGHRDLRGPREDRFSMKNCFLLTCTDGDCADGRTTAAYSTAMQRLSRSSWPLYARTKNRRHLILGARCLVYVGGKLFASQSIVATCAVGSVEATPYGSEDPETMREPAPFTLNFSEVHLYLTPVPLRPLLPQLTFAPKNLRKWGGVLQGGCIRIAMEDYRLVNRLASLPTE